jgi:competence CoiA-like predicted nuclease
MAVRLKGSAGRFNSTMSLLFGAWHPPSPEGSPPQKVHISDYVREMKGNVNCAACAGGLIAKRGALKVHHYAHRVACTAYAASTELMTSWHAAWQEICLPQHVEVSVDATIAGKAVRCVADIRCANGTVIEVQHSTISSTEMLKREAVHDDII